MEIKIVLDFAAAACYTLVGGFCQLWRFYEDSIFLLVFFSWMCYTYIVKNRKGLIMKRVYMLEYRDFARRECKKVAPSQDIVSAINWAKGFCRVNNIRVGWIVSPSGKRYLV